mgnify:CR=1 FL=1
MKKNIKLSDKVEENFIKWGQSVEEFMMKHFEHPLTKKILNNNVYANKFIKSIIINSDEKTLQGKLKPRPHGTHHIQRNGKPMHWGKG